MATNRSFLILLACAVLLILRTVDAETQTAQFIVSGNTKHIFPVLNDDPQVNEAHLHFEKLANELKGEFPDAFMLDAGRHLSMSSSMETGYLIQSYQVMKFVEYDVINLQSRDAVLATDGFIGLNTAPQEMKADVITSLGNTRPEPLGLPHTRRIEKGGVPTTFVSYGGTRDAAAMGSRLTFMREPDAESLTEAVTEAREKGDLVVGFSSSEENAADVAAAEVRPDLLFVPNQVTDVEQTNGVWTIPVPPAGEFLILSVPVSEGRISATPVVERRDYVRPDLRVLLTRFPTPRIGEAIPNIDHVIGQFFPEAKSATSLDRFSKEKVDPYSAVDPNVYRTTLGDLPVYFYRVRALIPSYFWGAPQDPSWPQTDMIVVLEEDGSLVRVVTRVNYPIMGEDTRIFEAANKQRGTHAAELERDPELTAGAEELWDWLAFNLEQTANVHRMLYQEQD
jgi:hypothetical protein